MEKFNPENYRSYSELPDNKRKDFAEIEGGFVQKEAAQLLQKAREIAKEANENRPLLKKIFSKQVIDAIDVLHDSALFEFRSQINDLYSGVMSISLWEELSKEEFEKMIENVFDEARRDDPSLTKDQVSKHFKDKAQDFAQWLENTKHRPFFRGSEQEIENTINKIRSLAK